MAGINLASTSIVRIWKSWVTPDPLRITLPLAAKDTDVIFAVPVPITDDRSINLSSQLDPKITRIPASVSIEVNEPLTSHEDHRFIRSVSIEVAC
jgi:hypothetical protein